MNLKAEIKSRFEKVEILSETTDPNV